jgi:hypothetical protein
VLSVAFASIVLLMQAPAGAPNSPSSWIVSCDLGSKGDAGPRVFRLGPEVFQEWKPETRSFGPNLCQSFQCLADASRLQGTIRSTTLTVTIQVEPGRQEATWQTQGASGLSRTSGACTIQPDKPSP